MALTKNEFQPYYDGADRAYYNFNDSPFSSNRMVFESRVNCCGKDATRPSRESGYLS
jgi:hypothetical protein